MSKWTDMTHHVQDDNPSKVKLAKVAKSDERFCKSLTNCMTLQRRSKV